jgi:chitin disaccharide deacetylase
MPGKRYLIVNADDFGLSEGVNRGIIRTHEQGILTSASLMVRYPAAVEAARYASQHPRLSVGLHLDLAEWVYRNYEWVPRYQVVPPDDEKALAAEVTRQLAEFERLMGRGPTHIDSHQHVHRSEPARSVVSRAAEQLSVPLRSFTPRVQYCGDFYGQTGEGDPYPEGISVDGLLKTIQNLPAGLTELGCHPGQDEQLDSVYRSERIQEVKVLCDPQVRAALEANGASLCSFAEVPRLLAQPVTP